MKFEQKYIVFIDILGFKQLVEKAENNDEINLEELLRFVHLLKNENAYKNILENGPIICPNSQYLKKDLNLKVTQISDCVISSAEISPSGLINILHHSWTGIFKLMQIGIMCRGYITKGSIYHQNDQVIGSGYQKAFQKESSEIVAFQKDEDEYSTPFVEIDPDIVSYVEASNDKCLIDRFAWFTKSENEFTALFPFKQLSILTSSYASSANFEPKKSKESTKLMRENIRRFKKRIEKYVRHADKKGKQKAGYYLSFLDKQLEFCKQLDDDIDMLNSPFPRTYF